MSDAETLTTATEPTAPSSDTAPAPRRGRRGEEIAKILFVVPAALTIIALFGYPVVKNLVMSFQNYTLRTFISGEAPWVGLQNYVAVVTDELFAKALTNTALFTIGSIVGQFVIGMLLALFFHKNFPLNGVLRAPPGEPSSNKTAAFSTSRWKTSGSSTRRSRGSLRQTWR